VNDIASHAGHLHTTGEAMVTTSAAARSALVLGTLALAACASGSGSPGAASSTSPPATPTVTVTVTVTPSSPAGSTTPSAPSTTAGTPSAATADRRPIPSTQQGYTQDFVTAWVHRDQARAALLGTPTAVQTAFAHRLASAPTFRMCEGTAGSSYCTFDGAGYTVIVRVRNDLSTDAQPHAVIEVRYSTS
jgi:hypothetical protein